MQLRYFIGNCQAQTGSFFNHSLGAIETLGNLATLFLGHAESLLGRTRLFRPERAPDFIFYAKEGP